MIYKKLKYRVRRHQDLWSQLGLHPQSPGFPADGKPLRQAQHRHRKTRRPSLLLQKTSKILPTDADDVGV